MDIKGIDQIYYGQLQSLDAADRQIFQLDAQQGGQNVEGGKPLAFRLVQPDNADQTRAADNRATRENLFRVLSDAKGLDTEFVNMLRSRLGIAENGTAAGDQALSALDAREVINLAKAKSADLDGMLEPGKTLRKVQFDANVKSVLRQTLSREANNPVVIDFLDPSKQPPSLNALTKLCKLATMVKLPNASWESDLAVAYLKGFSATITDEIKLCGSLENPLVDEDKAVLEATKQGQRDYETEKKALEEPKAEEPKVDEENHEPPKVVDEKPEKPKTTRGKNEWVPIPCNDDVEGQTDNNQDEYDNILDISNDRESKQEEDTENEIVKGQNETGANQQTIANGSFNEKPEDNEPVIVQGQEEQKIIDDPKPDEPKTEVHQPETTMVNEPVAGEVRQEKTDEVDEPVIVPEQKPPEDRELDKLLDAVVRLNARRITDPDLKAEGKANLPKNALGDKDYKAAIGKVDKTNELLSAIGKLTIDQLAEAFKPDNQTTGGAKKSNDKALEKAFFSKKPTPESIRWALAKVIQEQSDLKDTLNDISSKTTTKHAIVKEELARLHDIASAWMAALQELEKGLKRNNDVGSDGATVAEWMARHALNKVNTAEVRTALTGHETFGNFLSVLEKMSHGEIADSQNHNEEVELLSKDDLIKRMREEVGKLKSFEGPAKAIARDLAAVLTQGEKRLMDTSLSARKEALAARQRLAEATFGDIQREFKEVRDSHVGKLLLRSIQTKADAFDELSKKIEQFVNKPSKKTEEAYRSAKEALFVNFIVPMESDSLQIRQDTAGFKGSASEIRSVVLPKLFQESDGKTWRKVPEGVRGRKTGIPVKGKATQEDERLIKALYEVYPNNNTKNLELISIVFPHIMEIHQRLIDLETGIQKLSEDAFSASYNNPAPDTLECVVTDQSLDGMTEVRLLVGKDTTIAMCETECLDKYRVGMRPYDDHNLNRGMIVNYNLPGGTEAQRFFVSESNQKSLNADRQMKRGAWSDTQQFSKISVVVSWTAELLGVQNAVVQSKLGMCNGAYGVLSSVPSGQNASQAFGAVMEWSMDETIRTELLQNPSVQLMRNIRTNGYNSNDRDQRKLVGSLAKGAVNLSYIDLITGQAIRNGSGYRLNFNDGKAEVTGVRNDTSFPAYKIGLMTYRLTAESLTLVKESMRKVCGNDEPGYCDDMLTKAGMKVDDNPGGYIITLTKETPNIVRFGILDGLGQRNLVCDLPPYMSRSMATCIKDSANMTRLMDAWKSAMDEGSYKAACGRLKELIDYVAVLEKKGGILDDDDEAWGNPEVVRKLLVGAAIEDDQSMHTPKQYPDDVGTKKNWGFVNTYMGTSLFGRDFKMVITKVDGEEVNPAPQPAEPKPAQ